MAAAYQLFRPVAYLAIKGEGLNGYRFAAPTGVAVASCLLLLFLPVCPPMIGEDSVSGYLATFFVALPGFYIAALAAVVAFNGGDLDKKMPGVKVSMTANGDTEMVEITLRVFLSYLFSYLTVLSFVGFFMCMGVTLVAPSVSGWINSLSPADAISTTLYMKLAATAVLAFLSASVVFCTAQGLYFLAERVHLTLLP